MTPAITPAKMWPLLRRAAAIVASKKASISASLPWPIVLRQLVAEDSDTALVIAASLLPSMTCHVPPGRPGPGHQNPVWQRDHQLIAN